MGYSLFDDEGWLSGSKEFFVAIPGRIWNYIVEKWQTFIIDPWNTGMGYSL